MIGFLEVYLNYLPVTLLLQTFANCIAAKISHTSLFSLTVRTTVCKSHVRPTGVGSVNDTILYVMYDINIILYDALNILNATAVYKPCHPKDYI